MLLNPLDSTSMNTVKYTRWSGREKRTEQG
jgi:hypothetical protein